MQLEVDEPVSPSSSYSGPTMPTQKPPHHPWLMPPPVGYVKPPSLFPDVPRRRVQPSPSWARSDKFPHNNIQVIWMVKVVRVRDQGLSTSQFPCPEFVIVPRVMDLVMSI